MVMHELPPTFSSIPIGYLSKEVKGIRRVEQVR
jgi:hypothetical protein